MKQFLYLVLVSFLLPYISWAKNLDIDLGVFFRTRTHLRGAPTWNYPTLMIGPSFTLFEHYKIRGPGVVYENSPKDSQLSWSLGLHGIDDDKPWFTFKDKDEDYRNQRNFALELASSVKYKFGEKKKHFVETKIYRELIEYQSLFCEFSFGLPLLPFTSTEYALAIGEKDTHQYLYGTSAVSGISYHQLSLKVVLPFLPWGGVLINNLSKLWIGEKENRHAELVRGQGDTLSFSSFATWKVY